MGLLLYWPFWFVVLVDLMYDKKLYIFGTRRPAHMVTDTKHIRDMSQQSIYVNLLCGLCGPWTTARNLFGSWHDLLLSHFKFFSFHCFLRISFYFFGQCVDA